MSNGNTNIPASEPRLTQRRARHNLRKRQRQDYKDLRAWSRDAGAQAQKAGTGGVLGRMLGTGGSMAGLWALSQFIPGLNVATWMYALAAGAGSYFGSEEGEKRAGGYESDPLAGNLFYKDDEADIIADIESISDKADTARIKNAGIDALTAYISVGGNVPGLKGGNKPFAVTKAEPGKMITAATEQGSVMNIGQMINKVPLNPFKQIMANLGETATAPSLMNILKAKGTLSAIEKPFSIYNDKDK